MTGTSDRPMRAMSLKPFEIVVLFERGGLL